MKVFGPFRSGLKLWDTEDITYICHFLIVAAITKLKVLAFYMEIMARFYSIASYNMSCL